MAIVTKTLVGDVISEGASHIGEGYSVVSSEA